MEKTHPDEKSVITYVASYYYSFARKKIEMKDDAVLHRKQLEDAAEVYQVCVMS